MTIIGILIILYIVGIVGVTVPLHEDFMLLTPLNLLTTFLLSVWAQKDKQKLFFSALLLCYVSGLVIELLGVHSKVLFGEYRYGATLGWKIFETPLIIGVNWAMLVYAVVSMNNRFWPQAPLVLKAALGATMMVALDILIEPVAVHYDFWAWAAPPFNKLIVAPIQNYVTWWLAAFVLNVIFQKMVPNVKNAAIDVLFYLQCVFFAWIIIFVIG